PGDPRRRTGSSRSSKAGPTRSRVLRRRRQPDAGAGSPLPLEPIVCGIRARRLEESPGPEQTPLRLGLARLDEARIARLSAVPGVGTTHAETAPNRNSARCAEKLQSVVVGRSLGGAQPGDAVSQTDHLPTRAEQPRARSDSSSGTIVEV